MMLMECHISSAYSMTLLEVPLKVSGIRQMSFGRDKVAKKLCMAMIVK